LTINKLNNLLNFIISYDVSIRDAIKKLNETSPKVIFIVNNDLIVGSLTDGDVRRGLINDHSLDHKVSDIMNKNPILLRDEDEDDHELIHNLMKDGNISLIPKIDKNGSIEYLYSLFPLVVKNNLPNLMVIMAGGKGSRLLPLTREIPKALVSVGNRPMIEHIILNAKKNGISNFIISINHYGDKIKKYLGDGSRLSVNIEYIEEKVFLGTAGSLSLLSIKDIPFPIVVTNCDVISELDIYDLIDFHARGNNDATIVIKKHEMQNPFGIVKIDGENIIGFEEKPIYKNFINTGIYVLEKKIIDLIADNEIIDMPFLLEKALSKDMTVGAFHVHESWFDLGNSKSLKEADLFLNSNAEL
jgi:dTDP-glucose pyrophosphorylase